MRNSFPSVSALEVRETMLKKKKKKGCFWSATNKMRNSDGLYIPYSKYSMTAWLFGQADNSALSYKSWNWL